MQFTNRETCKKIDACFSLVHICTELCAVNGWKNISVRKNRFEAIFYSRWISCGSYGSCGLIILKGCFQTWEAKINTFFISKGDPGFRTFCRILIGIWDVSLIKQNYGTG